MLAIIIISFNYHCSLSGSYFYQLPCFAHMETGAWRSEVTQGHIAYKGGTWIPKPEKVRTQVHPLFPTSPWVFLGWGRPGWGWGMLWAKDIVIVEVSESKAAFFSGLNYLKRLFSPHRGWLWNPSEIPLCTLPHSHSPLSWCMDRAQVALELHTPGPDSAPPWLARQFGQNMCSVFVLHLCKQHDGPVWLCEC